MEVNREIVLALFLILMVILLYMGIFYNVVVVPIVGPKLLITGESGKISAPKSVSKTVKTGSPPISAPVTEVKSFDRMTEAEKINTMIKIYFEAPEEAGKKATNIEENSYINELSRDSNCKDNYIECPKWASNGECVINPEFMVYNCKSSCESCSLTPQQLYNITTIYNARESPGCAFHGYSYPDPLMFKMDVLDY